MVEKLGARCAPAQLISLAQLGLEDFPKTSSGKVRKPELATAVQRYMLEDQRLEKGRQDASTYDAVTAIWADLLGLQAKELTESTVTQDIADSLTSLKFLNKAEKSFRVRISMQELLRHNSIAEQVELIGSHQGEDRSPAEIWEQRSGPPTAVTMAHTLDSDLKASESRLEIESKALQPLGLSWEDVEDVLPMYDYGQHLLQSGRRTIRHVWMSHKASVSDIRDALEAALANHPILRATTVTLDSSVPLYIILRSSPRWINQLLTEHPKHLNSLSDLETFMLGDPQLEYLTSPCPLFRVVIVHVRESNAAGFILKMNHSVYDAISIVPFFEDLDNTLNLVNKDEKLPTRTPYKLWADNYFLHRSSVHAKVSLNYHTDRLKLLPRHVASLFPKIQDARLPTSGQTHKGAVHSIASAATPVKAAKSSPNESTLARIPCPQLSSFCRTHNVAAAVVVKASIAILNTLHTRQSHAVFGNIQAGRSWPFQEDWIAERLPNPIDVAGPTLANVINLVEINPEEAVLDLLKRMQMEQNLLTKHSHAPLGELRQHFALGNPLPAESKAQLGRSGDLILEAMHRQLFNWVPIMRDQAYSNLRRVKIEAGVDVGLMWACGLADVQGVETLRLMVAWQSELLTEAHVGVLLEQLGAILSRITRHGEASVRVRDFCVAGDGGLGCLS